MQGDLCRALGRNLSEKQEGEAESMGLILRTLAKMEEEREGSD